MEGQEGKEGSSSSSPELSLDDWISTVHDFKEDDFHPGNTGEVMDIFLSEAKGLWWLLGRDEESIAEVHDAWYERLDEVLTFIRQSAWEEFLKIKAAQKPRE